MKKIIIIILLLLTVINLYSQPARIFNEKVIFTNVPRFNGSNTTNNSLKSLIIDKDGNLLNLPYTTSNNTVTQQQVVQKEDEVNFPLTGQDNVIYIASHSLSTNNVIYYVWNGSQYTTTIQPSTGLTGIGLTNKVSKFSSPSSLSSSQISDDGTSVGINTLSSLAKFNIKGLGTTVSSKNTIFMDSSNRELMSISNNGSLIVSNKSTDDSNTITASINTDLGGSGFNFVGLANGVRTFVVDRSGNIIAGNIVLHDIFSSGNLYVIGGKGLLCTNTGNVNSTNTFLGTPNDKWESNVRLKYASDLSSSYDDRTLVDKGYVTNHIITPIAGNGININYANPIVPIINEQPLGKITVTGLAGAGTSNLEILDISAAHDWLTQYTNATITDESFVDNIYRFTVPANSDFSLATGFCGAGFENVQFEDPLGLVTVFGSGAFNTNNQNNILGNVITSDDFLKESLGNNIIENVQTGNNFLRNSSGNNIMGIIDVGSNAFLYATPSKQNTISKISTCGTNFGESYTGRMDVGLFGADGTANLPTDIFTSSNLVWVNTPYSNKLIFAGSEDGDIGRIRTNLTNGNKAINYEGIVDLSGYELLSNKQTDLTSSATKYPTVDAVNTGLTNGLATKQDALVSGTNIKTINGVSLLGSTNIVTGDALTSSGLNQFANTSSSQLASIITDETGSGSLVFNNGPTFLGGITITGGGVTIANGYDYTITGGSTSNYLRGDGSPSNFVTGVRNSGISTLTLTNSALITGESTTIAFGKLQGQINARAQYFTNNTTTTLSSATLNSTYPTATTGTHVYCTSIVVGAMIYERTLTGWIGWTIFVP